MPTKRQEKVARRRDPAPFSGMAEEGEANKRVDKKKDFLSVDDGWFSVEKENEVTAAEAAIACVLGR